MSMYHDDDLEAHVADELRSERRRELVALVRDVESLERFTDLAAEAGDPRVMLGHVCCALANVTAALKTLIAIEEQRTRAASGRRRQA